MNLKYSWRMAFKKFIIIVVCLLIMGKANNAIAQIAEDLIVIANDIGVSSLTKKQVISYLKGEKNFWESRKKVLIALPSSKSELATIVARSIYKTSSEGMQKYWLSLVFQGRADPPMFFGSDEETIKFVTSNKGSIGFIRTKNKSQVVDFLIEIKTD